MDIAIQQHGLEGWTGEVSGIEEVSNPDGDAPLETCEAAEEDADAEDSA